MINKILLKLFGAAFITVPKPLLKTALKTIKDTENLKGLVSSEFKHSHAYASLKKECSGKYSSRQLGIAIELALRM